MSSLKESSSVSSSNASSRWTFHVFLSFRGQDTREGFTNRLYAALVRKGIITFIDNIELEKGDVISQELLKSIKDSLATIVVLSENYASSAWCLDELQTVLESKAVLGRHVFPVFYGVTPSDVQHHHQEDDPDDDDNSFAKDLRKHAKRYGDDKVQKWRVSLREVAAIPDGWEFKKNNQDEAEFIDNIVESVWTKLRPKMPSFDDGLIGIDSRVKKMNSLLIVKDAEVNDSVQGIILNSSSTEYEATWDPEAFSKMFGLRLLICNSPIQLRRGLKCLCSSLKILQWQHYPLEALPLGVQLAELVDLRMHYSKIIKIWDENQFFANLKYIDLCDSNHLIETPIVSGAPCLQSMLLDSCTNLVKVHQSVGQHKKLALLSMRNCINLQTFPRKLEMESLEKLIFSGCSKVKKLPEFGTNMKCLLELSLENCKNLLCLPESIINLKSLRRLDISGCLNFSRLPNNMNKNESLEELDLRGTDIREISSSQVRLQNLKEFSFGGKIVLAPNSWNLLQWISKFKRQPVSKGLILPPLSHLSGLTFLDLSYCNLESFPSDLGSLKMLQGLDLSWNNFVEVPAQCLSNLSALESLSLTNCPSLQSLPMLPPNVQSLYTINSTHIQLNLDAQMLWKIFESHMNQREDGLDLWFIVPGREIPSWFDNQVNVPINPTQHPYDMLGCDSITSIIVDVPNYCQLSEWWGIAVCLAFEPIEPHIRPASVGSEEMCIYYWACKSPDREPDPDFSIGYKFGHLVYECSDPYIHIIFLTGEHIYIEHYLSGEQNQLELIFFVENLSTTWRTTINRCGCRVLCKEDIEYWRNR
ncbi:hypothetical protein RIF29_17650 [Crotalaria pallida]|uniref:TIR domain-containing protein n=1 Tax=Crotalaria pallida TaxID=3830 RepID=A0AAN9FNC6_CROPI